MRKLLFFVMAILLFTAQLSAQSPRTITGKITDEKGDPVYAASVIIKGAKTGTTTNNNGEFTLNVPGSAKALVVSAINFASMEVPLNQESSYTISLKEDNKNLEEVVVTGYSREKRSQFVGAATRMSSKVVETVPVGAFDQALQGRAPGVLVNSSTGQPGSSATVTIRGVQSIQGAGAQPLYIIDGVPLPASEMQTINANDFESITVLKDASAAALYGARGGVGVIVITTKKGKTGATNIMYRTQVGFTQAPNSTNFDMMNTTEILQYEERIKLSGTPGWDYSKNNPSYAMQTPAVQARRDFMLDSIGKINTNYGKLLFRQGISQLHELNMNGGSDKTRFFLSASYFDQKGTDLSSRLKRYTTRFNIEHTTNKLTVQFNTLAGFSQLNFSEGEWLGNSARNSFQMSWRAKPYENPYKPDGTLNYGTNTTLALKQIANVLEGIENSVLAVNQIKINTGLTLAYKLLPSVTIKNTLGVDVSDDKWQRWIRPNSYVGSLQLFQAGINSEAARISSQIINTSSAVFSKRINNIHEVEVGGYFEVVRGYQKAIGLTLYNLDARLPLTGQGAGSLPISTGQTTYPQNSGSAKSGFGIRSYFATARYTYDNKYTISGNVRRDGTSRIANEANKEINTWSAGVTWNAIEENFLKTQNIFSDIKFRASYGQVPNIGSIATGNYTLNGFLTGFLAVTNFQSAQIPAFSTTGTAAVPATYAGSPVTGLIPITPGNPDYKIESIKKLNIGVDLAAFNNRARLTVDIYRNKTIDLFVRQPLPAESGFVNLDINAGIMTNRGFEAALSVDIIKKKEVDLTFGINHAMNKNNIEDLGLVNEYFSGTFVIREGLPYGSHYTYHYLGADPATGRPRYETTDGKETTDIGQAGQFAKFGTYLPKHYGGVTADFRWGRLSISALFSYQFDVVRSNNIESWVTRGTPGYHTALNGSKRLLTQQWQKPGDVAFIQASGYDRDFTSADLQDARFLRFRNLNVSYQIPEIAIKGTRIIKSAKFYVQAQNIYVWSTWRGPDPEDGNNISLNEFPNPRMIVTGIDINF